MSAMTIAEQPSGIDRIFGAVLEPQTYKNLGYLLLSFPLGIFYFVLLTTGLSVGLSLSIIVIGLPILFALLWLIRALLYFERHLTRILLNANMREPAPVSHVKGFFAQFKALLDRPELGKGIAFLFLQFPMGLISFLIAAVLVPVSGSLLFAPLMYQYVPIYAFTVRVDNLDLALILAAVGAMFLIVTVHAINGWAALCRKLAEALLG